LRIWEADLVHMHGVDFHEYLPPAGVPVLATLHLPVSFYPASVFCLDRPETYLNCVSNAQRKICPPSDNLVAAIENGIPLDLYPERRRTAENYVLALGRICPEKGAHLALDAAEQAGVPLWVAGAVFPYPAHEQYFREVLAPRLKAPHRYLGPVGCGRKIELLSRARCVLISSLVPETSSLVAMEAMACGTPVLSFPSGALASMIAPGRTGFLAENVSEMAVAIRRAPEIDERACRHEALTRFSADRMADQYIDLYNALAAHAVRPGKCAGSAADATNAFNS